MSTVTRHPYDYAGLRPRFLALVIDFVILSLVFLPVTRITKGAWIMSTSDHRWSSGWFITDPLCLVFLGVMVIYFILLEGLAGATLGKRAVGVRVVDPNGHRPGLARSVIRNLLRAIDSLPVLNILGVVLILKSPERARFGDRFAGTRVVRTTQRST